MATETQTASEAAPKKGRKLLIIITAALVLFGAGGGAGWYFFMKSADPNAPQAPVKPKPSVFLALEPFTVNLLEQDGQPQFMQTALTLKLAEQPTADLVKERMPEVRDRILMVLSGKKGSELIPVGGKQKLANEISGAIRAVIAPQSAAKPAPAAPADAGHTAAGSAPAPAQPAAANQPTVEVLFTAFIIQ